MDSFVLLNLEPPIATLILNRPTRHNSLIPELLEDLLTTFETIRTHPDIRPVVLQANGRSFSSGGDLQGFVDHLDTLEEYSNRIVGLLNRVILAMLDFPLPIIAAVHGMVTGGSLGLVLASDVVLVTEKASFAPYYSVVGFSPDGGWTAMLPSFIGLRRTSEILLANQTITAEKAVAWGLANRMVPAENLHAETLALAQKIASHQPGSLRPTKQNLRAQMDGIENRLDAERERFVQTILTPETQRSMMAFLKRL